VLKKKPKKKSGGGGVGGLGVRWVGLGFRGGLGVGGTFKNIKILRAMRKKIVRRKREDV